MDALGKFGELERSVRVARGAAERNFGSFKCSPTLSKRKDEFHGNESL